MDVVFLVLKLANVIVRQYKCVLSDYNITYLFCMEYALSKILTSGDGSFQKRIQRSLLRLESYSFLIKTCPRYSIYYIVHEYNIQVFASC